MAYQRFDGTMSFLPSRFEAQAMLSEMQKKKDEEMKLIRLKQAEEQKHQTEALRSELNRMLTELKAMTANREATMSKFFSQTSIPPRPPFPPPDPPDIRKSRQDLTIKAPDLPDFNQSEQISTNQVPNKLTLRYSCEEIHERMTNGLCIFCEDLDTPGHYNLKHKRSKICLVECVDDRLPDEELVEPAVEEISNKSVTMIQDEESNPENESRPEVSVSQFQVPFSSMEPGRSCHNHYESLDVVDERMCNELVCDKDGDSINTLSAPFNLYQNCNDQCHYKREFGNYTEHGIEFDRASDEIEDDELQDKQIEQIVETLVMNEGEQPLGTTRHNKQGRQASKESSPVEVMHWINKKNEAEYSPNEKIVYTLTYGLCQAKRDHEEIRVLEKLIQPEFSLDLLDCSSLTGLFCKPKLEVEVTVLLEGNMNIKRATFFGRNVVKWKCWLVVESRLPLHYWVAWRKLIMWEVLCILQNNAHRLLLAIHELQKGKLWFSSSNGRIGTASGELQEWNVVVAGHLLFDMVEKSNYLDEVIEEVAKTFILAMINEHKDIKTACVFLEKGLNRERLIQLGVPPVFSDLLCVVNRIRVRLKMALLLEFLWLILSTSKMFKSSDVHQNKNQTDQKLSSYWKLLLWLLHPLHINRWRSFFNVAVTSCSSYVKVLELIKDKASRKRKLCKNWWFKYKLNTWLSEVLHLWRKRKSEKLQRASKHMICELIQMSWDMSIFGKSRTRLLWKMRIVHGLEDLRQLTRAGIKFHLKHKWRSKFESNKLRRTWTSYSRYDSSSCVLQQEENYVMVLFPIAGISDISIGEFRSVCKPLFGIFVLNLITEQVHGWSFFGLLLQWKWHPPPQGTSEFHQVHIDKSVFHL